MADLTPLQEPAPVPAEASGRFIEALATYVPMRVLLRLASGAPALTVPCAERFTAAGLFVDISGSTMLAERLGVRGPVGAEELSRVLNTYFGQLIEIIAAHGGDIVKFAGDGLLALWRAAEASIATATHRAAQCGLTLQQQLHDYPVADGIRLSARIGVGGGATAIYYLGGADGQWEFLVSGPSVARVCAAERQAQPGEIVLMGEVWPQVSDAFVGRMLPTGDVRVEAVRRWLPPQPLPPTRVDPAMECRLRGVAPAAILARLAAGQREWLAELRRLTVVFIQLPDMNDALPLERAQSVMCALQSVLRRYQGTIGRLGVDEKGATLLAAFGLPPLVHEDDATRAVQAARAIHEALQGLQVRAAIGIATGRTFCGALGNERRREYAMIGTVANLAARLMQAADEGILCDTATHQAARESLTFDTLPAIAVRGWSAPVAVFCPRDAAKRRTRLPTALVGRTAERAQLAHELDALRRGTGGVLVIDGEAGIGKSRLVEDFCQQSRSLGVTVLAGAGDAIEESTSYYAWRPIFRQVCRLDAEPADPARAPTHALQRLMAVAGPNAADGVSVEQLAPLLNAVLPLDLPESDLTASMSAQGRADNTHELLVRLLSAVAQVGPLLIVLEDAQWLDSASWALARLVADRLRTVLLVVVTRSPAEPPPADYRELLARAPRSQRVALDTLSGDDALRLAGLRLGVDSLPEPVAALIREKAGGHPFFSEELGYALRDAGLIAVADGACRVVAPPETLRAVNFPDTVEGVITSRIDRLTPRQQLALKVASVIGRVFPFRTLRDVHPIGADKAQLPEDLDALERLDITPIETPAPQLAYIFKHAITQEVAYSLLPFAQRRQLHRTVAESYERSHAADLASLYPTLAHHWRNAVDERKTEPFVADKAIDYLEKAGEQALQRYANPEAVHFFTEALRLQRGGQPAPGTHRISSGATGPPPGSSAPRVARWEQGLGEAYFRLGRASESRAHLQRALALMGHPAHGAGFRMLSGLFGQLALQIVHRLVPRAFLGRARASRRPVLRQAAAGYEALGTVLYIATERLPSVLANVRALNLAEAAGPSSELARCYATMIGLTGIASRGLADRYFERALTTARRIEDPSSLGRVWFVRGYSLSGLGEWADAGRAFDLARETFRSLGDRRWWEQTVMQTGNLSYAHSRFARGLELYAEGHESALRRGDVQAQAWAVIGQAIGWMRRGDVDAALSALESLAARLGEDFGDVVADRAAEINAYALCALGYARRGDRTRALRALEHAVRVSVESPPFAFYGHVGLGAACEVVSGLWETQPSGSHGDRLPDLARRSRAALRKFARIFPIAQPQAWLWQGCEQWHRGHPAHAQRAWRRGLAVAERLVMPYEEGLLRYEAGRRLTAGDPQRVAHLERARDVFRAVGADLNAAQAQAALGAACGATPGSVLRRRAPAGWLRSPTRR